MLQKIIHRLLPKHLQQNNLHGEYENTYTLINGITWGIFFLLLITGALHLSGFPINYFLYNAIDLILVLPFFRWNLHRQALVVSNFVLYIIYFPALLHTGGIYSVNIIALYVVLMSSFFGQPKIGLLYSAANLIIFCLLYIWTPELADAGVMLGSRLYALLTHILLTVLMSAVFYAFQKKKDELAEENRNLQSRQISRLNEEVLKRTEEINSIKRALAFDFHDETGNLLSAITRQASLLKLTDDKSLKEADVIDNIIANSNRLYASSRHFIWYLNNNSSHPHTLFQYLVSFAQQFFNAYPISFSADDQLEAVFTGQLAASAPLSLIFIFTEAMDTVVKQAGASEVVLAMKKEDQAILFSLAGNGTWQETDSETAHHDLHNIQRRCAQNKFRFAISHSGNTGTCIEVGAPFIES